MQTDPTPRFCAPATVASILSVAWVGAGTVLDDRSLLLAGVLMGGVCAGLWLGWRVSRHEGVRGWHLHQMERRNDQLDDEVRQLRIQADMNRAYARQGWDLAEKRQERVRQLEAKRRGSVPDRWPP